MPTTIKRIDANKTYNVQSLGWGKFELMGKKFGRNQWRFVNEIGLLCPRGCVTLDDVNANNDWSFNYWGHWIKEVKDE